ncbi:MAG TPA: helix-turn-helix transcriptional regulator [Solirubrobacterales bacterium]|nr:helix-turn-helix transcriptional regulator [Solirubrobacterales bacterium]
MDDSVGNKLREARSRRKLSLEEVEAETKIRARYLQAIENEDWDQLPEDTYTRAFIRTYGRFLGLDGDRLAEEQRRSRGAARPGERLPRVDPRPRPVVRQRQRRRSRISPRVMAAAVTALVIAVLLAIGLATGGGSDTTDPKGGKASPHRSQSGPHVGQAVPVR